MKSSVKSSVSIGIVGLPNVGKSTLFKLITKKQVDCSNYPFCTIEPNVGVVAVPDKRLDALADLLKPEKKIYTTIEFIDIAGLIKGAHKGEGLGNQFLAHIREVDAIVYVLRAFESTNAVNVSGTVDPLREKDILDTELMLKDIETLDKVIERLKKDSKSGTKEIFKELDIIRQAREKLNQKKLLVETNLTDEEKKYLKRYQLLTVKPRLYLLNGPYFSIGSSSVKLATEDGPLEVLVMDVAAELEAEGFTPEEREELGLPKEPQIDVLIKKAFELLDLITFFTILSKETRAWAVKRGTRVPQAAGIIHTDFEEKFIRAEVINWKTLIDVGSFAKVREKGLVRTEGKEYVVQDGDVVEVKHS